jgi:hypothetical protein
MLQARYAALGRVLLSILSQLLLARHSGQKLHFALFLSILSQLLRMAANYKRLLITLANFQFFPSCCLKTLRMKRMFSCKLSILSQLLPGTSSGERTATRLTSSSTFNSFPVAARWSGQREEDTA